MSKLKILWRHICGEMYYWRLWFRNKLTGNKITYKGQQAFDYFTKISWNNYQPQTYAETMLENDLIDALKSKYLNYDELTQIQKDVLRMQLASQLSLNLMAAGANTEAVEKWTDENEELY